MNQIICGDAIAVMQGMEAGSIDLIVTDPPYGMDYKSHKQNCDTRSGKSVKKDRPEYFSAISGDSAVPLDWLAEAYRVLKDGSAMYIFCHWSKWHLLYPAVLGNGFLVKNMIVMNKSNHGMGDLRGAYSPKFECVLFATKGRHILQFPEKRLSDVWSVPVRYSGAKRLHPNEKPLSWLTPMIECSSVPGNVVLDCFCGSGSIGVAALKLRRRYMLIDVDEGFVEVARERLK